MNETASSMNALLQGSVDWSTRFSSFFSYPHFVWWGKGSPVPCTIARLQNYLFLSLPLFSYPSCSWWCTGPPVTHNCPFPGSCRVTYYLSFSLFPHHPIQSKLTVYMCTYVQCTEHLQDPLHWLSSFPSFCYPLFWLVMHRCTSVQHTLFFAWLCEATTWEMYLVPWHTHTQNHLSLLLLTIFLVNIWPPPFRNNILQLRQWQPYFFAFLHTVYIPVFPWLAPLYWQQRWQGPENVGILLPDILEHSNLHTHSHGNLKFHISTVLYMLSHISCVSQHSL